MSQDVDKQMRLNLTLGEELRRGRERMELGISDVAYHLRIAAHIVEQIENDAYDSSNMTIFMRGYIRAYARLVNVPSERIDDAFEYMGLPVNRMPEKEPASFHITQHGVKDKPMRLATYGLIALLVILMGVWRYTHYLSNKHASTDAPAAQPASVSQMVSGVPTADATEMSGEVSQEPTSAQAEADVSAEHSEQAVKSKLVATPSASSEQPAVVQEPASSIAQEAAPSTSEGDSVWVDPDEAPQVAGEQKND